MTDIVGKLWGFCHTLRHDGIDYGDYIEQLTYLLFLKMIEGKGLEVPSKTGGFLVCAYEWLMEQTGGSLERSEAKRILTAAYSGTELVPRPRRLALMNLYLHGIQANIRLGDAIYEPKFGFDIKECQASYGGKRKKNRQGIRE